MSVLKLLLSPFSFAYKLVTDLRNHLYDIGYKPSVQFDRYVVSVGNLTVGGTGKTPFVELLIRLLNSRYKMAVLSRGYGRKTRGFRMAGSQDNASTLGDEPFQYYIKYGDRINIAVGEERALAIPEILFQHEDIELIVLDDAFQHRAVRPNLNILLNDFNRPFYKDRVLPAGRLRESRKHARRSDAVIVTKCPPHLGEGAMKAIEEEIRRYAGTDMPIFFTGIEYLEPKMVYGDKPFSKNMFLFTGIANPTPLENYVKDNFYLIGHAKFPDHHSFSDKDIQEMIRQFENIAVKDKCFLTTEKDMVRILSMKQQFLTSYSVFYLPIELYFLKNEDSFARYLYSKIDLGVLEDRQK
jgi:tetraacyldisaccharide 4'-kinase